MQEGVADKSVEQASMDVLRHYNRVATSLAGVAKRWRSLEQ
jgi:hypothetical protein